MASYLLCGKTHRYFSIDRNPAAAPQQCRGDEDVTVSVKPGRTASRSPRQFVLVVVAIVLTAGLVVAFVADASSPPADLAPRPAPRPSTAQRRWGTATESLRGASSRPCGRCCVHHAPLPASPAAGRRADTRRRRRRHRRRTRRRLDARPHAGAHIGQGVSEAGTTSTQRQAYTCATEESRGASGSRSRSPPCRGARPSSATR